MGELVSMGAARGMPNNNAEMGEWLEHFGNAIRHHDRPLNSVILVIEGPDGKTLTHYACSKMQVDRARLIGLLSMMVACSSNGSDDDELGLKGG